jgi:hypothetical protein
MYNKVEGSENRVGTSRARYQRQEEDRRRNYDITVIIGR